MSLQIVDKINVPFRLFVDGAEILFSGVPLIRKKQKIRFGKRITTAKCWIVCDMTGSIRYARNWNEDFPIHLGSVFFKDWFSNNTIRRISKMCKKEIQQKTKNLTLIGEL